MLNVANEVLIITALISIWYLAHVEIRNIKYAINVDFTPQIQ